MPRRPRLAEADRAGWNPSAELDRGRAIAISNIGRIKAAG